MASHYDAYMLRLWQVETGESAVWRASLENPHTGESSAFASLEALTAYLKALTRCEPELETPVSEATAPSGEGAADSQRAGLPVVDQPSWPGR